MPNYPQTYYIQMWRNIFDIYWPELQDKLKFIFEQFYKKTEETLLDQQDLEAEEIIDLFPFEINAVYNKEDEI